MEREYKNTLQEIEVLKLDVKKLSKEAEYLQDLYTKRDELLGEKIIHDFRSTKRLFSLARRHF